MKLFRLFGLLSLFALLFASQSVLSVQAETVTKDFGQTNFYSSDYSGHNIFATMNVKATVETEPNGHWTLNNTYQVNVLITITYVNESVYSANGFAIECYQPDNPVYDAIMIPSKYDIDVTATPQNSGIISMTLRPQSVGTASLEGLDFALRVYYNDQLVTSGSWDWGMNNNNQPITITVDSNQHLPFSTPVTPELTPLIIVVVLFGVSFVVLVSKKTYLVKAT